MPISVSNANRLTCAVWGPLDEGRLVHMDCPVVVTQAHEGVTGSRARTEELPIVCDCECSTCKRAWWNAGRPILKDGQILKRF